MILILRINNSEKNNNDDNRCVSACVPACISHARLCVYPATQSACHFTVCWCAGATSFALPLLIMAEHQYQLPKSESSSFSVVSVSSVRPKCTERICLPYKLIVCAPGFRTEWEIIQMTHYNGIQWKTDINSERSTQLHKDAINVSESSCYFVCPWMLSCWHASFWFVSLSLCLRFSYTRTIVYICFK